LIQDPLNIAWIPALPCRQAGFAGMTKNLIFGFYKHMVNKKEKHKIHLAILKQLIALSTSGFGLVAALAWNNVIQELVTTYIKPLFPAGSLVSLFLYAVLITALAVIVTYNLSQVVEKLEKYS
jgi:hypothetical protein